MKIENNCTMGGGVPDERNIPNTGEVMQLNTHETQVMLRCRNLTISLCTKGVAISRQV